MPYPEIMIRPMREELTRLGFDELRAPEQVDDVLQNTRAQRQPVVDAGGVLADHASTQHQAVGNDLSLGGSLF